MEQFLSAKFLSGRNSNQKIGILDSTENVKVLEVVGRAGIGTTIFDADYQLDVRGDAFIRDTLTVDKLTVTGAGSSFVDLNVTGVSTFGGNIDANAGLDVAGIATFASDLDVNASVDISTDLTVDGLSDLDELNVAGVSTFASDLDVNASVDISGHTELDTLNVSVATTSASLTLANAGVAVTAILDEDDLISNRDDALATQQSIKAYVDSQGISQDLDFAGDTGTGAVDLGSETFTIAGTANEIETVGAGNTLTIGLPNVVAITTSLTIGSATTITGAGIVVGIVTGTLDNDLTLATSGTGLSGSATYNNSGAATFTVASNATDANTGGTIVARDGSGNFSAGTITADLVGDVTGTATTATNLANGANITTGTISDDRLPDLITSNINIASGISSVATLDATNATIDNLTFTSGTAITSVDTDLISVSASDDTLASAKAIKDYIDGEVSTINTTIGNIDLDFAGDTGTGAVDLGSETFTIAGTANEIETVGAGNTLTIGLPNVVAITTSLSVGSATTINSSGINAPTGIITASSFVGSLTGDVTGVTDGIASTATQLETARDFSITGSFVTASAVSFDGTANVALGATITPDSITLGTYTSGDYVESITGTSNEIEVTGGTGEGSTPQIGLPNDVTITQDLTVNRDVQIVRNLNVDGNITIGGTTATLFTTTLEVADPDLILGVRTDALGNDISTDNTANHGGIAIASTEGNPLVVLTNPGAGETLPSTYKKIMWFKSGSFAGLGTDAWLSNYAVGIGSTQFPTGTRLAAGSVQFTENDLAVVRNINASGIITATSFVGDGSGITGVAGTGGLFNLVEDTTPQLGGNLDLNSYSIDGIGNINITGIITTSGDINVGSGITLYSSTGIISATSYYGSGGNLEDIIGGKIGGLQVQEEGSNVGTGFTFSILNFVGPGVTATAGIGSTATITIPGDISVDTTPQLGGDLDLNSNDITGTGNVNITGIITATSFVGDGSGITGVAGTGGLSNLVEDTTPQLGGDLDLNGNNIDGTGNVNITGIITATSFSGDGSKMNTNGFSTSLSTDSTNPLFKIYHEPNILTFPSGTYTVETDSSHDNQVFTKSESITISTGSTVTISTGTTFKTNIINLFPSIVDIDVTAQDLNVLGISTFSGNIDANSGLDVDGLSDLDELNVAGIATFASDLDINASVDISNNLNVTGVSTFASDLDINASVDISNNLNVSGISTLGTIQISSGIVTASSGIVTYYGDGTNLDNVKVAISATTTSLVAHNTTFATTGLSTTITPIDTSKKVYVDVSVPVYMNKGASVDYQHMEIDLRRNGTSLMIHQTGLYVGTVVGRQDYGTTVSFHYVDSPSTVGITTYEVFARSQNTTTNYWSSAKLDFSNTGSIIVAPSHITLMEVD